jgi:hypothetical protein
LGAPLGPASAIFFAWMIPRCCGFLKIRFWASRIRELLSKDVSEHSWKVCACCHVRDLQAEERSGSISVYGDFCSGDRAGGQRKIRICADSECGFLCKVMNKSFRASKIFCTSAPKIFCTSAHIARISATIFFKHMQRPGMRLLPKNVFRSPFKQINPKHTHTHTHTYTHKHTIITYTSRIAPLRLSSARTVSGL